MVGSHEAEDQTLTEAEYIQRDGRLPAIIGTATGGCFHVLDPRPEEVRMDDVAHHLAHIGRYTGACSYFWSVAAHCLEVSRRVEEDGGSTYEQLCGLLHDASEAYLVDIPRPFKPDVSIDGYTYRMIEDRVQRAIFTACGLPYSEPPIVERIDKEIVSDEVANFFPPGFMWKRYSIYRKKTNLFERLTSMPRARDLYHARFDALMRRRELPPVGTLVGT